MMALNKGTLVAAAAAVAIGLAAPAAAMNMIGNCEMTGQKGAICAWATKDSIGEVVPVTPGYTRQQVAKLMLDVREDVESTK